MHRPPARYHRRIGAALLVAQLAACAAVERPTADQLGQRVRLRVAGREIASILTQDYFVFFAVLDQQGQRVPMRIRVPESGGSKGMSLAFANIITMRCDCGDLDLVPSRHGDDPECVADLVLPDGYALDFSPGSYVVYEVHEDRTLTVDRAPELRLAQITRDGSRYIELPAHNGPDLAIDGRPPGFEATR